MGITIEYILVSEDFPMDLVYNKIGLAGQKRRLEEKAFPTLCGEPYIRQKECSITFSTGEMETIDTEEPLKKIVEILLPKIDQIARCVEEYRLTSKFCIVLNISSNPAINLPYPFIDLAAKLHANVEFDTYMDFPYEESLILDDNGKIVEKIVEKTGNA